MTIEIGKADLWQCTMCEMKESHIFLKLYIKGNMRHHGYLMYLFCPGIFLIVSLSQSQHWDYVFDWDSWKFPVAVG